MAADKQAKKDVAGTPVYLWAREPSPQMLEAHLATLEAAWESESEPESDDDEEGWEFTFEGDDDEDDVVYEFVFEAEDEPDA